jgi:hypothetical protein
MHSSEATSNKNAACTFLLRNEKRIKYFFRHHFVAKLLKGPFCKHYFNMGTEFSLLHFFSITSEKKKTDQ